MASPKSGKIALCGMLSAVGAALMLASYFPFLTYAIPALSGILLIAAVIEAGSLWALGAYVVTAVLVFFLAEPEAKLLYIVFFGYYPILKGRLDRLRPRPLGYLVKFLVFNAAVFAACGLSILLSDVTPADFGAWGVWGAAALLLLGNAVFRVYDVAVERVAQLYMLRLHPSISRLFRQGGRRG